MSRTWPKFLIRLRSQIGYLASFSNQDIILFLLRSLKRTYVSRSESRMKAKPKQIMNTQITTQTMLHTDMYIYICVPKYRRLDPRVSWQCVPTLPICILTYKNTRIHVWRMRPKSWLPRFEYVYICVCTCAHVWERNNEYACTKAYSSQIFITQQIHMSQKQKHT